MTGEKIYFRIGEVSERTGVAAHTIRYWESEFSFLKPMRDRNGRRLYTAGDIEKVRHLKETLHRQGYSVKGAKKLFRSSGVVKTVKEGNKKNLPTAKAMRRLEKAERLLKEIENI